MNQISGQPECPHCNEPLKPFTLPEDAGWEGGFQFACFNNDCPYYTRGWEWMNEKYGVKASYRYRVDPDAGKASPLAVWSPTALVDRIVETEPSPATDSEGDDE